MTYEDGEIAVDRVALESKLTVLAGSINQLAKNGEIIREQDGSFSIQDETLERTLDVEASADVIAKAILSGDQEAAISRRRERAFDDEGASASSLS